MRWRLWCETEGLPVMVEQAEPPLVCPVDPGHKVRIGSVVAMDAPVDDGVSLRSPDGKTWRLTVSDTGELEIDGRAVTSAPERL